MANISLRVIKQIAPTMGPMIVPNPPIKVISVGRKDQDRSKGEE
jgi:hypothetical protein